MMPGGRSCATISGRTSSAVWRSGGASAPPATAKAFGSVGIVLRAYRALIDACLSRRSTGMSPAEAWNQISKTAFGHMVAAGQAFASAVWNHRVMDKSSSAQTAFSRSDRLTRKDGPSSAAAVEPALSPRRKGLFCGLFPPPVDGQRLVTQRVYERLDTVAEVARFGVDQFPRLGPISKLVSAIVACFVIFPARAKGYSALYLAPHSGAGLICSCLIALFGRGAGWAITLHYHSYWNMGRDSRVMAAFLALSRPQSIHLVR